MSEQSLLSGLRQANVRPTFAINLQPQQALEQREYFSLEQGPKGGVSLLCRLLNLFEIWNFIETLIYFLKKNLMPIVFP
jgi:hypothetical protein